MYDPKAPSSLLALAQYADPATARHLLRYGMWLTKDPGSAEDLVADAMERVLDPDDKPWDPAKASFRRHVRMLMCDDRVEQRRGGFGKYETVDSEHEAFDRAAQPAPPPDSLLHRKRKLLWMREMWDAVVARLKKSDRLPIAIYELACKARHDEPEEFAKELGVPVVEIYEAMRRLRYHAGQVRTEWEAREARRLAALREASARGTQEEER